MMKRTLRRFAQSIAAATVAACSTPTEVAQPGMQAAKAAANPVVEAADPPYGYEGEVDKVVTITGSGFDNGSKAAWERNGAPDPKITVHSTQFVSASQLTATISIANDADLAFYDIAVTTSKGRKGIGTERFEVTQAIAVAGTTILRGVNEAGLMGGTSAQGAKLWSQSGGLITLPDVMPDPGGVTAVDEAGTTATGFEGGQIGIVPLWTNVAGVWQNGALPDDPTAIGGHGWAIASDPVTGEAVYIGGWERFKAKGNSVVDKPRLWQRGIAGWTRFVLPSLASTGAGVVNDVTPSGFAVGKSNGIAVIWEPTGTGAWTISALPGAEFQAAGINSAGDLIVGGSTAYWTRSGVTWTLHHLPVACRAIKGVDDLGRIAADDCAEGSKASRPAVFTPPYVAPPVYLGSLGLRGQNIEKISRRGGYVAGNISGAIGVYWKPF